MKKDLWWTAVVDATRYTRAYARGEYRAAGHAIDDIAVELPGGRPPDVLITSAESVPGVEVESMRPHSGHLETHHELELIDEIAGDPDHGLDLLADGVPRIFRAGWALIARREGTRSYRLAQSSAAPETSAGAHVQVTLSSGPPLPSSETALTSTACASASAGSPPPSGTASGALAKSAVPSGAAKPPGKRPR